MAHISIVSPVYACKTSLIELYVRLKETLEKITLDFEIIFVNDASPDGAWETIIELAQKDKRVKGVNLTRNFGQHYAITAGLDYTKGEWVVVMDCDLQDQPEEIIKLYNKVQEGYDYVTAIRKNRKDSFSKILFAKIFYKVLAYLTDVKQENRVGNFGVYNKKVISSILSMHDYVPYFPSMVKWVGYKYTSIEVAHCERKMGKTSYSYIMLVKLALNVILAFSDKPLKLTMKFGFLVAIVSVIFALFIILKFLFYGAIVIGWSSLIVAISFFFGVVIFLIGLLGLYIGKIFEKVKDRPRYIISEKLNND